MQHMSDPVMQNTSSDANASSSFHSRESKPAPALPAGRHGDKQGKQGSLVVYTIVALGAALIIRFFIAAPFIVQGASMLPTFNDYHYLIVDRLSYDFGDPKRGDVIVFDLPQNTSRDLIKRVIGLPGETVILSGSDVTIENSAYPDGFTLPEPYLSPENLGGTTNMRVTLGPDQYFVLGDNRKVSSDSRSWGTLPREDIVGRVLLRLFPLTDIGLLPGQSRY